MVQPVLVASGEVNSVNYSAGTVRVDFSDIPNNISPDLPMFNAEYKMPSVGDRVVCLFLSNNPARGYCLGTPFSQTTPPPATGEGVFYKDLGPGAWMKFDSGTGTLTFHAPKIVQEESG